MISASEARKLVQIKIDADNRREGERRLKAISQAQSQFSAELQRINQIVERDAAKGSVSTTIVICYAKLEDRYMLEVGSQLTSMLTTELTRLGFDVKNENYINYGEQTFCFILRWRV